MIAVRFVDIVVPCVWACGLEPLLAGLERWLYSRWPYFRCTMAKALAVCLVALFGALVQCADPEYGSNTRQKAAIPSPEYQTFEAKTCAGESTTLLLT